jgi:mRNA interferase MazF
MMLDLKLLRALNKDEPVLLSSLVERATINTYSPVVLAIPCTTYQTGKRVYPTQVLIKAPDGGLTNDSIAMADQVRV